MSGSEHVDVAIIGAGPAGLAAAHALVQVLPAGAKVAIFEKGPAISFATPRGAGLGLEVNGVKALRAISPEVYEAVVNNHAITMVATEARDTKGKTVQTTNVEPKLAASVAKYGEHGLLLGWHELVLTLAELLPPGVKLYNSTKFLKYDEVEAGVKLRLLTADSRLAEATGGMSSCAGQAEQEVELTAGLLVAADGYFSPVREQCIHDGPPDFGGNMFWRARLQGELAARFGFKERHSVVYLGENRIFVVYTVGHGDAVWTASCPEASLDECGINWRAVAEARRDASAQSTDYLQRTEANGLAARERLLRAFQGFDPAILDLIASTTPASIVEHALYTRPAAKLQPEWFGKGRVVIIGDAAHPMRPTGQGVNQGLEDALLLARYVQRDGGGFGLLDELRTSRAARVQPIARHAEAQGKAAYRKTSEAAMQAMKTRFPKQPEAGAAAVVVAAAASATAATADSAAGAGTEERCVAAASPQNGAVNEPKKVSAIGSTDGQGDGSKACNQVLANSGAVGEQKSSADPGHLTTQGHADSGGAEGAGRSSPPPDAAAAATAATAPAPAASTAAAVVPIVEPSGLLENYEDFTYLGEDLSPLVPRAGMVVEGAAA